MDEQFEKWVKLWDAAQKSGKFGTAKVDKPVKQVDFFGCPLQPKNESGKVTPADIEAQYWDRIYKLSKGDSIVNESKEDIWEKPQNEKLRDAPTKDALVNKASDLANTSTPIEPQTRGIDQRNKVTPDWSDGPKIREIVGMKEQLYKLEVKINSNPKFGAYGEDSKEIKGIQGQIDELKDRMDKLSDSLAPNYIGDESS